MRGYNELELPNAKKTIVLDHLPSFDIADYDFTNEKDLMKYFKNIERICRSSRSYKKYIEYLRNCVDMTSCSFYKNVNNIDTYSIKIHIHHSPLTLFDLVTTIYAKRVACQENISENAVAKEVMFNHYRLNVGLIPLSETVHELVHNGYLFIPTNYVYGDYKTFVQIYGKYMDPQLKATLEYSEAISRTYDYNKETQVLDMHMVHIDPSGSYNFPSTEEVINKLQSRIDDIDNSATENQYMIATKKED